MGNIVLPWDPAIRDALRAAYLAGARDCFVFLTLAVVVGMLVWQHVRTPRPG